MALKTKSFGFAVILAALAVGLSAQARPPQPQQPAATPTPPTFRVSVDAVTMDVIVKDEGGRFIPDLSKDEFEIYEDGVRQDVSSLTVISGGRATNVLEAAPPPPPEAWIVRRVARYSPS